MNVRIQYDIEFPAGVYTMEGLFLNSYTASLCLITTTEDKQQLNTAMERLKCFVYTILKDTIFVDQEHNEHAKLMNLLGMNVTTLPAEPVDQIIGMMLYCKLNAVMEGRLVVTSVDISSALGEGVWYQHEEEENIGPFKNSGWWDHPGITNQNIEFEDENKKIVKVLSDSWADYELNWPEINTPTGNIVVYANFGKNENDPVQ
jgi:hypothetical protein